MIIDQRYNPDNQQTADQTDNLLQKQVLFCGLYLLNQKTSDSTQQGYHYEH
jgi:hypothetical protein